MGISKTRLAEIEAIPDEQIDTLDIPELGDEFFRNTRLVMPGEKLKTPVTMRVDTDVLEWFRGQGKGHQTRMNAVLRAYMLAQKGDDVHSIS